MRRRALLVIVLAAVVVAAAAVVVLRSHRQPHAPAVRGSTSTQFVPTLPAARKQPPPPGVAWPTYGYDAARLRAAPYHVRPPLRQLWTFHGRALLEFPPVVAYGRVFLPTFDGRLYALDARTGRVLWRHRAGRCGWASPAVAEHVVYITFIGNGECHSRLGGGVVDAYDAGSGRLRWERSIGPTESSPLVAGPDVIVGDWNGDVWALDARTGRTRWRSSIGGVVKDSVALAGGRLYVATYGGDVVCLRAADGGVVWRSGGHGAFYSTPAVTYGRVYIGSLDDGVYAFGAGTGSLIWSRPTGGYVYASPAVWHRLVLVGSYDHGFLAIDAGTGAVRWRFPADGAISGAASVIDGVVWFSTFAHRTYALDAATGRELAAYPDGEYSPAVADAAHLYLVGLGRLYALAPR